MSNGTLHSRYRGYRCRDCRYYADASLQKSVCTFHSKARQGHNAICADGRLRDKDQPERADVRTERKDSRMERIKRVCACGFKTDWPPAWGRHLQGKHPSKHYEVDEAAATPAEADEPVAHEHYCDRIDECRSDLSCTPCGADPCELVAADVRLEPRRDIRLELILAKLDITILRLALGQFEEVETIIDDLDRVHALVKEVAS